MLRWVCALAQLGADQLHVSPRLAAVQVLQPVTKQPDGGKRIKPFSTKLLDAVLPHIRHRYRRGEVDKRRLA